MLLSKLVRLKASRTFTFNLGRALKHASAVDNPTPRDFVPGDPFLGPGSLKYVEDLYIAWETDPKSVHKSWQLYFECLKLGRHSAYRSPKLDNSGSTFTDEPTVRHNLRLRTLKLASKFINCGHREANLDPLKLSALVKTDIGDTGFSTEEGEVELGRDLLPGYYLGGVVRLPVKEVLAILQKVYCSSIGFEFGHLSDAHKVQWLQERVESPAFLSINHGERVLALERLSDAESFERIFAAKFPTVKRYGIEGADALLPALKAIVDRCGEVGVGSVVVGMPHRGRLNVYTHLMGRPAEEVFAEFGGKADPPHPWSGDAAYHLAVQAEVMTPAAKKVRVALMANPSHLEAVYPVALGAARARQDVGEETLPVIVHGDAAVAGQGVVYEALGLHQLDNYKTGGSVHLIVNNQIGFTTDPRCSRSTRYCCDVAKMADIPVLHVNGDDVDAVLAAARLAVAWRQAFRQDIFIDLVCYRRNGHNEVDQPSYTQPKMYAAIAKHVPVFTTYTERLVAEGAISKERAERIQQEAWVRMEKAYAASKGLSPKSEGWETKTGGLLSPKEVNGAAVECPPTGARLQHLQRVVEVVGAYPAGFHVHPGLAKVLQARERMATEGASIDWATAEQLAFGTLLLEGTSVRLSGQDVERGTFSQRHAVLVDQVTEARYIPLNQLSGPNLQARFHPCNSHLSEFGVLGFEVGYSIASPGTLVVWEAQFGDFSNVAQPIIDQFVASGEQKWLQPCGIAMLLPHGFDGNGPEHSSGRLERYLQLADEDPHAIPDPARQHQKANWSVVSCTTPANYFHALRRQVRRPYRKPLVCFTGKGLLRHPLARSTTAELAIGGPGFQRAYPELFPEQLVAPDRIRTHVLCTGQVYFRLLRARQQNQLSDVAISRVEELAPFPFDKVAECCSSYPNAELVWCQEEPINMGAYAHVLPRIAAALRRHPLPLRCAGRPASAAVAVGHKARHLREEHELISSALYGSPREARSLVNGVPVF